MCNGLFVNKTVDASWDFLIEVAEKTQQWEPIREPRNTTPVAKVHRIESDFEGSAKIASLVRRIEELEMQKNIKPSNNTLCEHVEMPVCAACHDPDHQLSNCPDLLALQ
ncbi:uncharacterized protein LOC113291771 [Papaver somniferum]|uniref:uncharacterized protein LOC113291771 n=1 Tax=Papaver somniferum TaxID=3469 RepID=UPI000E6FF0E4|nr:uncharacterized protein LOC113291771 [Papaver somniferum]